MFLVLLVFSVCCVIPSVERDLAESHAEAHNEVVRNILNMAYECRFEEAKERVPLIKKLQELELI